MSLTGASPASLPSLDRSPAHLQPLRGSVPQGDPQTASLDVWDISRPHVLVPWDFFPSQQGEKPTKGRPWSQPHAQQLSPLVALCRAWTPIQVP